MKRKLFKKYLSLLLMVLISIQFLVGCSSKTIDLNLYSEEFKENNIEELYIYENSINETALANDYILENIVLEDNTYEYKVEETIIAQSYIIEIQVGSTTEEEILKQLPPDIEEYDINWSKVISKFAIGTTVILAVGVVKLLYGESTYFLFASPITVTKEALISGAIGATLNQMHAVSLNKKSSYGVKKYAIEGFASGFMWGAITSSLKIYSKNFKLPKTLKLSNGDKVKIKMDGSVHDKSNNLIGKAIANKDTIFITNESDLSIITNAFNLKGKEVSEVLPSVLPRNSYLLLNNNKIINTDDFGLIYRELDVLLPNNLYTLNNHKYVTDNLGRIIKADSPNLELSSMPRSLIKDTLHKIGKGFEQNGDDRGHLIAHIFGGDNSMANIIPMDSNLNRGIYKAYEQMLAKGLKDGNKVSLTINVSYEGGSNRPSELLWIYTIGDELFEKVFTN